MKLFLILCMSLPAVFLAAGDRLALAEKFKKELAPEAAAYQPVYSMDGKINEDDVKIFRFEPNADKKVHIKGPRIVVIVDAGGRLRGFAKVNATMLETKEIPEAQARKQAEEFLKKYAPDITELNFQWVSTRRKDLLDSAGKEQKVTGTWAKFRDGKSGRYLWVLFAPDGSVMEFDRESVWSFFRGGRVTEMWLKDDWFAKQMDKK